ncbi:MAG: hypothetical protein A2231_03655 [Candidatus Firestonebacteria bacterium RIFOXYA2_FULL_40_8]|nr:MAG: hypothetical protein A2231_03655 [Candidatus Firestonebacteria bacterium RIFOXYA2_FULL_40_8]
MLKKIIYAVVLTLGVSVAVFADDIDIEDKKLDLKMYFNYQTYKEVDLEKMFNNGKHNDYYDVSMFTDKTGANNKFFVKINLKSLKGDELEGKSGFPGITYLSGTEVYWKDFDNLSFKYDNTGKEPLECEVLIADNTSYVKWSKDNFVKRSITFSPGENISSIDINDLQCPNKRFLDSKSILGFTFFARKRPDIALIIKECFLEKIKKTKTKKDGNIDDSESITDTLITLFFKTNKFTVLERTKVDAVLKEQKFQLTGCTNTECAVEIGKILNMKYMATGSVMKMANEYAVNIKIINIESSEVVIADIEKYKAKAELMDILKKVVTNISKKKVFSEDSKQNTIGILEMETKK